MIHWTRVVAWQIWNDLSDRRGFGLDSLEYDDPEVWKEIQKKHAEIIREAAEKAEKNT